MNTTEYAAKIRKELKEKHGWNSRHVSVRADYYSMGSSIHVEIKDASIPVGVVKEIAEQAERISRCEVTGEILGGGNRFVEVRYSREAEEAIAADYIEPVKETLAQISPGDNILLRVPGTDFLLGRPDGWRITLWDADGNAGMLQELGDPKGAAYVIGKLVIARKAVRS